MYILRKLYIFVGINIFMKRKVVKHGTATLTISLPIQWARKFAIKHGDELDIEERGNRIIIKPYNERLEKEIVVNIDLKENIPRRLIVSHYIAGYNQIRVKYKHKEVNLLLQNIVRDLLMGFEIVEEGNNYCVLKNVARGIEEEFDVMFNRLFIISISMLKDVYDAFSKNDLSLISDSATPEGSANKVNLFCRRMLNSLGHKEKRATGLYFVVNQLEEVTDLCNKLSKYAVKNNLRISKDVLNYLHTLIQYVELWHKAFFEVSHSYMMEIKNFETKLLELGPKTIEKAKPHEAVVMHYLMSVHETVHPMTEEIF